MTGAMELVSLRTRIYIDGYNLYYGCLKGTPYKWLDLLSLFERQILPSILLPGRSRSDAIELLPLGIKLVDAEDPDKWPRDCQDILVWKLEEKQSDVNLALQAYHDAITGQVDQVVIVTNDTDIAPALQLIRAHTSVTIGLVIPTRNRERVPNTELANLAHWVRSHITDDELAASQLPRVIPGRRPTIKPESWYARPDLVEQIMLLATVIAGSRGKAFKWMEEANLHLDGMAPIDLAESEDGAAKVMDYIRKYIAHRATMSNGAP